MVLFIMLLLLILLNGMKLLKENKVTLFKPLILFYCMFQFPVNFVVKLI